MAHVESSEIGHGRQIGRVMQVGALVGNCRRIQLLPVAVRSYEFWRLSSERNIPKLFGLESLLLLITNIIEFNKRSLSQSLADTAVLAAGHAFDNLQNWLDKPSKEKQKLDRTISHQEPVDSEEPYERKSLIIDLLNNSTVPRDPLISPMYASDEVIRQLPPACHLDPLLDDTIAFASRLRSAGGRVASVDLLPAIPHGFLNFTLMSPECRRGAKICLERIKQALGYSLGSPNALTLQNESQACCTNNTIK
ncbi:hypothetical protein DICVIV_10548 [Dictyocaulus viviparus]|uniref:Uncharacterized protein n=1 Tax=Dictyocaulus viviparus TaxID=29172 RepID=A0A0D8XFT0_DICVI|nr:hypothetical protein DICVIV_10548 [Dictyocaulus viviparus]